jgi:uncharacterized protein YceK
MRIMLAVLLALLLNGCGSIFSISQSGTGNTLIINESRSMAGSATAGGK